MRIIYIAAISTGILFASCSNKNNNQQTKGAQTPTLPVIQIPSKSITGLSSYPVSLEGIVNAEVRAKIAGYVTAVLVDEGQYVSQGQPLFRLETDALTEDAEAAKANVEAAQVVLTNSDHL